MTHKRLLIAVVLLAAIVAGCSEPKPLEPVEGRDYTRFDSATPTKAQESDLDLPCRPSKTQYCADRKRTTGSAHTSAPNSPAVTGGGNVFTYGPSDGSYFTPEKECRPGYKKTAWHDPGYPYYIQCAIDPEIGGNK